MKKILMLSLVLALALTLCPGTAWGEENVDFLGKPFPDFTVADTEGNPFTLSEALKTHEAVLINFWATWCGPCKAEFPALSQVYAEYSDRVAFIALSIEPRIRRKPSKPTAGRMIFLSPWDGMRTDRSTP